MDGTLNEWIGWMLVSEDRNPESLGIRVRTSCPMSNGTHSWIFM